VQGPVDAAISIRGYNVLRSPTMKRRQPKGQRKETIVPVRMSIDQKAAMTAAGRRVGLSLSSWLRLVGLREAGWMPSGGQKWIRYDVRQNCIPTEKPNSGESRNRLVIQLLQIYTTPGPKGSSFERIFSGVSTALEEFLSRDEVPRRTRSKYKEKFDPGNFHGQL
jgi:hypothetical protein